MKSLRGFIDSCGRELPHGAAVRWASLFFSLHVLTLLVSIAASQAFLAAATIAYFAYFLRVRQASEGEGSRFPPVKLPLLLFCLATINSVLWERNPALGGFDLRKLVLFLILVLGVKVVSSSRHLRTLFLILFLESALAGLVGMAQFVIQYSTVRRTHLHSVYVYMTVTRIHGFMGHWMNFGGQQMLVFAALLAFLLLSQDVTPMAQDVIPSPFAVILSAAKDHRSSLRVNSAGNLALLGGGSGTKNQIEIPRSARNDKVRRGKAKGLYWLLMAVVATSIVLNFTRGVWLGCLLATLYILARWKPRMLWVIPVLLVVVELAAPSLIRRRVATAFHPRKDPALAIRLEMWDAGLRMIREHPWVGVGPGRIPQVYEKYLAPGTIPIVGYHDHLHDDFLQLAAERGLPCLIAWLWFMLALGWHILKARRRLDGQRWVADAALAAWLAFVAEGFFEFNFGTSPVLMVFLFLMSTPFAAEQIECSRL